MNIEDPTTVHTFSAFSMREALAEVRNKLGHDALILDQQRLGRRFVVRACLELPEEGVDPAVHVDVPSGAPAQAEVSPPYTGHVGESASTGVPVAETSTVAGSPRSSTSVQMTAADLAPPRVKTPGQLQALVGHLRYAGKEVSTLRGAYRFVGASGVGKTSLLMKLLVEWCIHNGSAQVLVVSTDTDKLAGTEALHLTCQMLNVQMLEMSHAQLTKNLDQLLSHKLVLIDAPALEMGHITRQSVLHGVEDVMVLSALHSTAHLDKQVSSSGTYSGALCAVTHLDELCEPEVFCSWLNQQDLQLAWLGTGAYVPGGIETANARALMDLVRKSMSINQHVSVVA